VLLELAPGVQRQPPVREVACPALRWVAVGAERAWQRAPVVAVVIYAAARLASPRPVDVVVSRALRRVAATARVLAWEHLRAPEAPTVVLSPEETVMPRMGSRMVARASQRALAMPALRA
jgi:hypothetical protein